jgi:iron-sulfur cluster repair protein YtfE (RIC family)
MTKSVGVIVRESHNGIVDRVSRLNRSLQGLRFEGKAMAGKNTRILKLLFRELAGELSRDMRLEEKWLFPYLEKHVPKLKLMLHILEEEHENLRSSLESFEDLLDELARRKGGRGGFAVIERLRRKGIYLNYFLHNHMGAENDSVYRIMMSELTPREKAELLKGFREK